MLYSGLFRPSYLGEGEESNAFMSLMMVLGFRIPHGYKPSPETMQRISRHPGEMWKCRSDSPQPSAEQHLVSSTPLPRALSAQLQQKP